MSRPNGISDIFDLLHEESKKYERLCNKESARLANLAQKGSNEAVENLVLHSLSLLIWASRVFSHSNIDREERFNICLDALLYAIHHYDESRGKFDSYVMLCLRSALFTAFGKYKRHIRWKPHIIPPQDFLPQDTWVEGRERLERESQKVSVIISFLNSECATLDVQVFSLRFNLTKDCQSLPVPMRKIGKRLGISVSHVWEILDSVWVLLKQNQIAPWTEPRVLKVIERIERLEELTDTTVHFETGLEAA